MNRISSFIIHTTYDKLALRLLKFQISAILMNHNPTLSALYHVRPEPRHELGAQITEIESSCFRFLPFVFGGGELSFELPRLKMELVFVLRNDHEDEGDYKENYCDADSKWHWLK